MKSLKSVRVVALLLALGGLSASAVSVAQDKGKKSDKMMAKGHIEIKQGQDDKFRFFVRDGDDKLVAASSPTGYETAAMAEKDIEKLKEIMAHAGKPKMMKKEMKKEKK